MPLLVRQTVLMPLWLAQVFIPGKWSIAALWHQHWGARSSLSAFDLA
jgi:hypothetical protein